MSNTIKHKITRLLTEAIEESEPAKVQKAFNDLVYLKESNTVAVPDRSSVVDSPDTISPYLYLYCAEAASRFDQWETVKHCVDQLHKTSSLQLPSAAVINNNNTNNNTKEDTYNNNNNSSASAAAAAPSWVDFSARALFVEATLLSRNMVNKKAQELINASKVPLAKIIRGISVAIEANRTVLVFAGVQQLWNIAQPLYKPGTCHHLCDVFAFANKALDVTQVQDPDLRAKWAMRLATCLNSPNNAISRDHEAAGVILTAEQNYSTPRNIVPLARATLAAAAASVSAQQQRDAENEKNKEGGKSSSGGADAKNKPVFQSLFLSAAGVSTGGFSDGKSATKDSKNANQNSSLTYDKNGNAVSVNVAAAVARVLPILNDATNAVPVAFAHGGVHPDCMSSSVLLTSSSSSSASASGAKNIIDDLLLAMKDLTQACQLHAQFLAQQAKASASSATTSSQKGRAGKNAQSTDDNNSSTKGGSKHPSSSNNINVADGVLDETLSECSFIVALLGVPSSQDLLAVACERCLVSRHHVARVYSELANSVLQAQRCGGIQLHVHSDTSRLVSFLNENTNKKSGTNNSNSATNPIVNGLISAIRRIEITLEGALRVQDELLRNTIVERCVTTMWNLSLPLLNTSTRLSVTKSFKVATRAMTQSGSTNTTLLCLLEHETALQEADQHFTSKAADRLDSCLKMDVIPASNALPETTFAYEHERWLKYQLKGLEVKRDLYVKHENKPTLEALRILHQAVDTTPGARPPILARLMNMLEDHVSPLENVFAKKNNNGLIQQQTTENQQQQQQQNALVNTNNNDDEFPYSTVPRRALPLDLDSWNLEIVSNTWQNLLQQIYLSSPSGDGKDEDNNNNAGNKKGGGKSSKSSKSAPSSPTRGQQSTPRGGKSSDSLNNTTTGNNNTSNKQQPFLFDESEFHAFFKQNNDENLSLDQQDTLLQQQWERTQMWSTLRASAWSYPSNASVELVRRVSDTLLQLPSADREIIIEQIRAALSHAETFIFEVNQLGLRFGQFELTPTSPEELQSDVKNFQRAIESARLAEQDFLTMVVAASLLSHHLVISKGNKEERWTMLNCVILLWEGFRESFESNLYALAFPAFQKIIPLFVSVMTNGQTLLGSELNSLFGSGSSSTGKESGRPSKGSGNNNKGDDNSNNQSDLFITNPRDALVSAPGQQNAANEQPSGSLPSTFESSLVSNLGVAAVRSALQQFTAECLKIDLSRPSIGDLRRIASTDFTRLSPSQVDSALSNNATASSLLQTAFQWCESLIPLCISADARELCKLSVVIRRYQGKQPEPRSDPVLQITTLIELADAASTSEERSLALVQAVELLQTQAQTVELCSRVADACVRYTGCERLCIATCAIGQELYNAGKLGKPVKNISLNSNNADEKPGKKGSNKSALKSPRGGESNNNAQNQDPSADSDEDEENQQEKYTYGTNQDHLPPDQEDWMFFALMLQCQGCAAARLSSSVDARTAEQILLKAMENLANGAAAASRVPPTHRLKIVARSVALFKLAAEELVAVSHGSASATRAMLPALRAVLAQPIISTLHPVIMPSAATLSNPQLLLVLQQQQEMLSDVAPSLSSDLARLMLLKVKALHLESLAEEGLSFLLGALKVLPNSEHKAFWDLDAAMRCSTNTPLNSTLLRVKEYDVHTQAQVWAAISRNAMTRPDQLFALTQAVKCFNPHSFPLEHATHLIALANWLLRFDEQGRGVTLDDIRTMMMRALDIIWRDFSALVLPSAGSSSGNHNAGSSPTSTTITGGGSTSFESSTNFADGSSTIMGDNNTTSRTNYGAASRTSSAPRTGKSQVSFSATQQQQQSSSGGGVNIASAPVGANINAIKRCSDAKSLIALLECVVAYCSVAPLSSNNSNNKLLTKNDALLIAHACVIALWKNTVNSINPMLAREAHVREQRELREQIQTELLNAANNDETSSQPSNQQNNNMGSSMAASRRTGGRRSGRSNTNNSARTQDSSNSNNNNNTMSNINAAAALASEQQQQASSVRAKAPQAFTLPTSAAGWCNLEFTAAFGAALLRLKENDAQQAVSFWTVKDPTALCCVLELVQDLLIECEMDALVAPIAALEEVIVSYLWTPSHMQQVALQSCDMKRRALAVGLGVFPSSSENNNNNGRQELLSILRSESHRLMQLLGASFGVVESSSAAASSTNEDEQNASGEDNNSDEESDQEDNNKNDQKKKSKRRQNQNDSSENEDDLLLPPSSVSTSTSTRYATVTDRWVRIITNYFKVDSIGNALLTIATQVANLCAMAKNEAGMNRAMIIAGKILHNQGQPAKTVHILHGVNYSFLKPEEKIDGMTHEASVLLQLEDVPSATAVLESLNKYVNDEIVKTYSTSSSAEGEQEDNNTNVAFATYRQKTKPNLALCQLIEETLAPELQFLFVTKTAQALLSHANRTRLRAALCDALSKFVVSPFFGAAMKNKNSNNKNSIIPQQWKLAAQLLWLKVSSVLKYLTEERERSVSPGNSAAPTPRGLIANINSNNNINQKQQNEMIDLPSQTEQSLDNIRNLLSAIAFDFADNKKESVLGRLVSSLTSSASSSASSSSWNFSYSSSSPRSQQIQQAFAILSNEVSKLAALKRNAVEIYRTLPHVAAVTYPTVEGAEKAGLGHALSSFMRSTKRTRRAEAKQRALATARAEVEKQREVVRQERIKEIEARRAQKKMQEEQAAATSTKKSQAAAKKFGINAIPAHMMTEQDFGFTPLDRTCGIPSPEASDDEDDESLDEDSQSDDDREAARACEEVLKHKFSLITTSSTHTDEVEFNKKAKEAASSSTQQDRKKQQQLAQQQQSSYKDILLSALTPAVTSWAHSTLLALNASPLTFSSLNSSPPNNANGHYFINNESNPSQQNDNVNLDEESEISRHLALPARLLRIAPDPAAENFINIIQNSSTSIFSKNIDGTNTNSQNTMMGMNERTNNQAGGARQQQGRGGNQKGTPSKQQQQQVANSNRSRNPINTNNTNNLNSSKNSSPKTGGGNKGFSSPSVSASPFHYNNNNNNNNSSLFFNPVVSPSSFTPLSCITERQGIDTLQKIIFSAHQKDQWRLLGSALGLYASAAARSACSNDAGTMIVVGVNDTLYESQVAKLLELSQSAMMSADIKKVWAQLVDPACGERVAIVHEGNYESSRMAQRLRVSKESLVNAVAGTASSVFSHYYGSSLTGGSSSTGSGNYSWNSDSAAAQSNSLPALMTQAAPVFEGTNSATSSTDTSSPNQNIVSGDQLPSSFNNGQTIFLTITRAGGSNIFSESASSLNSAGTTANASTNSDLVYAVLRRGPTTVDLRAASISQQQIRELNETFAAVARQRQNVLSKPTSSTARNESLSVAEATFRVAMAVFAQVFGSLLSNYELAFKAGHQQQSSNKTSSSQQQLVLCIDFEFQGLPWEKSSFFHHRTLSSVMKNNNNTSSSAATTGRGENNNNSEEQQQTTDQQQSSSYSSSPSYFKSIIRDLSFYHAIARQVTWKKFELSPAAVALSLAASGGTGGKGGGGQQQSNKGGNNNNNHDSDLPFSFATTPNGVCMAVVDQPGVAASSFDLAQDPESRPRGYHWKHTTPFSPSPFEGALSQVESWFSRSLLSGGAPSSVNNNSNNNSNSSESGNNLNNNNTTSALLPTSLLFSATTAGRFPFVVRSSLWSSMDLSHLRSAYLLDQGMTQSSKVVDEAAHIKSATAVMESNQPYVLSLLMLARGVNFVMSSSYNLPLTPHSSRQMTKMVTRVLSGEIGVDKTTTGLASKSEGGKKGSGGDQQQQSGGGKGSNNNNAFADPALLSQQVNQNSATMARGMSEIVHYALHCQPVLYYQKMQEQELLKQQQQAAPATTTTTSSNNNQTQQQQPKRTSSKEGRDNNSNKTNQNDNNSNQQQQQYVEKPYVEMSESEVSCIALWGANL